MKKIKITTTPTGKEKNIKITLTQLIVVSHKEHTIKFAKFFPPTAIILLIDYGPFSVLCTHFIFLNCLGKADV